MNRSGTMMLSRFRGALMGVLIGDCCGAPFEGRAVDARGLANHLDSITKSTTDFLKYTDDTAMTISTCRSLLKNNGFNAKELAREYTESYFKEPRRGYGAAVRQVFTALRDANYKDPYGPANQQFEGKGSFGNGAAMRCNGIALFTHKNKLNYRLTQDLVTNCSKITHSHRYAINGAILLVTAIRHVLTLDDDGLDEMEFLEHLIMTMADIENSNDRMFTDKLRSLKKVVENLTISGADITQEQIVELLGNDVSAQNSVPLAIYSFLRGCSKFTDSYHFDNEFIRTLHWAISCGGDTDTIASMACGLSGAYFGIEKIPNNLYKRCESYQEILDIAEKLAGK